MGREVDKPLYRQFGVAVTSYKAPTMLRRHSRSNGGSSRLWLLNWCAILLTVTSPGQQNAL